MRKIRRLPVIVRESEVFFGSQAMFFLSGPAVFLIPPPRVTREWVDARVAKGGRL
jgi:hypothetical protein